MELTDQETTNAKTEAQISDVLSGKPSVGVSHGPVGKDQPTPLQQKGPFKSLLSKLPFFGNKHRDQHSAPAVEPTHKGMVN